MVNSLVFSAILTRVVLFSQSCVQTRVSTINGVSEVLKSSSTCAKCSFTCNYGDWHGKHITGQSSQYGELNCPFHQARIIKLCVLFFTLFNQVLVQFSPTPPAAAACFGNYRLHHSSSTLFRVRLDSETFPKNTIHHNFPLFILFLYSQNTLSNARYNVFSCATVHFSSNMSCKHLFSADQIFCPVPSPYISSTASSTYSEKLIPRIKHHSNTDQHVHILLLPLPLIILQVCNSKFSCHCPQYWSYFSFILFPM